MDFDTIIIGGGPAGIMAGIRAGERGRKVLLLERNRDLSRKLLLTGGGRCNITNIHGLSFFLEKFSRNGIFLRNAFAQFFNTGLLSFFEEAGLKFKEEEDGCIFPESGKAEDVLSILKSKLAENGVKVILGERVCDVIIEDNRIKGIVTDKRNEYYAPHLVIASGGLSYPETGSTGDGYKFAKKLKHNVMPLLAGLVPIEIKEDFIKGWQGISLKNVCVSVLIGSKKVTEERGDLVFTHFGLSGPVILDLSAGAHKDTIISINFLPDLNHAQLNDLILGELKKSPNRQLKNLLDAIIPKNMTEQFLKCCNIQDTKKSHQLTAEERKHLINKLFDFRLTVKRLRPVAEAIITRGGICTDEINPKTMESKLVKGLFFAGEVIDIDAKCGGYNLQAAFSTGWVAGNNV